MYLLTLDIDIQISTAVLRLTQILIRRNILIYFDRKPFYELKLKRKRITATQENCMRHSESTHRTSGICQGTQSSPTCFSPFLALFLLSVVSCVSSSPLMANKCAR